MYVPNHFAETRVNVLHELIRAHPFGTLVVLTSGGLDANHIPFEIDPEPAPFGTLRGHVARANAVWKDFSPQVDALAIFQGPHTYISPAWYPSKERTRQGRTYVELRGGACQRTVARYRRSRLVAAICRAADQSPRSDPC